MPVGRVSTWPSIGTPAALASAIQPASWRHSSGFASRCSRVIAIGLRDTATRRRNSANSIQDEMPAEIVSPATPHRGAIPNACGSGIAESYPSTVVKTTRIIAKFSGVRVSFNA